MDSIKSDNKSLQPYYNQSFSANSDKVVIVQSVSSAKALDIWKIPAVSLNGTQDFTVLEDLRRYPLFYLIEKNNKSLDYQVLITRFGSLLKIVSLPYESGDVDDLYVHGYSVEEFNQLLEDSSSILEHHIENTFQSKGANKDDAYREVFFLLAQIKDEFSLSRLRDPISKKLGIGVREYDRLFKLAKRELIADHISAKSDNNYVIENNCLCEVKYDKEGERRTSRLSNFTAAIVEDAIRDDGEERAREFTITGRLCEGQPLPKVRIQSKLFPQMNWVTTEWGVLPVVRAGWGSKDKLREAIQLLSEDVESRYIFTHTGWRTIDEKHTYLSSSGALGIEGVSVELEQGLENYCIPSKSEGLIESIRASLRFLDIAPHSVTYPILASVFVAPLSEIIYPGYVLWMYGVTGAMKSTLAALALSHFGFNFDDTTLPIDWWATPNAIEKMLFLAKDALIVIDDFRPESDPSQSRELETKAARIIRHVGNRSGRGRMNADLSLRSTYIPRGLVISTGEQLPGGHSVAARLFTVELCSGDVDLKKLTLSQEEAEKYPHALGGYLKWISEHWDYLVEYLPRYRNELRQKLLREDQHTRLPKSISTLYIGLVMFLQYAVETGAISETESSDLRERGMEAILDVAQTQARRIEEERPSRRFLTIIADLLCQERITLKDTSQPASGLGGFPDSSEHLGWCDQEYVYLIPGVAFNVVSRFCIKEGNRFPVKDSALRKALKEEGYLTHEKSRNTTRIRVSQEEIQQQERVLKIRLSDIQSFAGGDIPTWPKGLSN